MDMDQVELDAAYDQSFYAPLQAQIIRRQASSSELARVRLGAPRRKAYGPTEPEKLDIHRTARPNAPIFAFIHGGAWLGGEVKNYAYAAEMFVNTGAHFVALDFVAIEPAGGDLRVMADQVRRGVAWVYKNAASFGSDASRLYVGGHSSGGHLCGVRLVTDWQKDFSLPADIIKGGLCLSGLYDMKPVRLSKRSLYVKFTDEMEQAMSSQRHLDLLRAPVTLTYGSNKTPAPEPRFRRGGARRRQAGRVDRSCELQPFRNGGIAWQSLWTERTGGACDDEAFARVSEIARRADQRGRLRVNRRHWRFVRRAPVHYRNGSVWVDNTPPTLSTVLGSGPRPSAKARSCARRPCNSPGKP
jgi:arylformamidase